MFPPKKKEGGPLKEWVIWGLEKDLHYTGMVYHSCPAWGGLLCLEYFVVSEEEMEEKVGS